MKGNKKSIVKSVQPDVGSGSLGTTWYQLGCALWLDDILPGCLGKCLFT